MMRQDLVRSHKVKDGEGVDSNTYSKWVGIYFKYIQVDSWEWGMNDGQWTLNG